MEPKSNGCRNPLISIIIPVYNVKDYLCQCLDSVLAQSYQNLEIILVDDGSDDGSRWICDRYAQCDERIVVIHKKNEGASAARNAGLDVCQGEYISFIDSDDIVSPFFIEILYDVIFQNNSDICATSQKVKFDTGNEQRICKLLSGKNYKISEVAPEEAIRLTLYEKLPLGPPWRLCKKHIFNEIRFPEQYLYAEDVATTYKLYMKAEKVVIINAAIYGYRKRSGSTTQQKFSEKKLACISIADNMVADVLEYDIRLVDAAKSRAFALNYQVFLEISILDTDLLRRVWEQVLIYRRCVLGNKDPYMKKKYKLGAYCTFGGMYFSNLCGKIISKKIKF